MAPANDAEKEERLKAALWYSVGQTIDSVSLDKDINATPHFIGAMSEMLWAQIGSQIHLSFRALAFDLTHPRKCQPRSRGFCKTRRPVDDQHFRRVTPCSPE